MGVEIQIEIGERKFWRKFGFGEVGAVHAIEKEEPTFAAIFEGEVRSGRLAGYSAAPREAFIEGTEALLRGLARRNFRLPHITLDYQIFGMKVDDATSATGLRINGEYARIDTTIDRCILRLGLTPGNPVSREERDITHEHSITDDTGRTIEIRKDGLSLRELADFFQECLDAARASDEEWLYLYFA